MPTNGRLDFSPGVAMGERLSARAQTPPERTNHGGAGWQAKLYSKMVEGHRTPRRWRVIRKPR